MLVAWALPLDQCSQSGQLALRAAAKLDADVYILPLDEHRPQGYPPLFPDASIRDGRQAAEQVHWVYSLTDERHSDFLRLMQLGRLQPGVVVCHGEPSGPCVTRFLLQQRGLGRKYERLLTAAGYSAWLRAIVYGNERGSTSNSELFYAELQSIATGFVFVGGAPTAARRFFPPDWVAEVESVDEAIMGIDQVAEQLVREVTLQLNASLIRREWTLAAKSIGSSIATVGGPCSCGTHRSIADSIRRLSGGVL